MGIREQESCKGLGFETEQLMARSDGTMTSKVQMWWAGHDKVLLRIAVGLMAFSALVFLGYEFWRLLWQPDHIGSWRVHPGAIDLKIRHRVVQSWFAGESVYGGGYPPASIAIFWPLHGWLEVRTATFIWAATTVAALGWLVYLVVREGGANTHLERIFLALMPLSMYATGATIGNGQLIIHLLPMLVAGLLLLHRGQPLWRKDLLAAVLVLVSLSKPSISVPFFWIVLFVPGRLRPALLVSLGYILLTVIAASFQEAGPLALFRDWLADSSMWAWGVGHAHLGVWLFTLGLEEYNLPAMFLVLMALGFWTYYCRHVDLWLLLGVAGLVARFWAYHRWYDDLLILLPMIALFRLTKRDASVDGVKVLAGALLGITMLASIAPGGLYLLPAPWNALYVDGQVIVWGVVLMFLLNLARRERNAQTLERNGYRVGV
jgi:hypothetical protein